MTGEVVAPLLELAGRGAIGFTADGAEGVERRPRAVVLHEGARGFYHGQRFAMGGIRTADEGEPRAVYRADVIGTGRGVRNGCRRLRGVDVVVGGDGFHVADALG